MVLVLLEVGEGDLEYPALQRIVRVLETGGAVDEGLADAVEDNAQYTVPMESPTSVAAGSLLSDLESSWGLDVVPVLLREGVGLLLETLLSL